MPELTLDHHHVYRLDGMVIPSVTSILREAGVIDYTMIPQAVLQAAARRGTATLSSDISRESAG